MGRYEKYIGIENLNILSKIMKDQIDLIQQRNKKVEADKAWEISLTRKFVIALITYLCASLFLYLIKVEDPFVNSLVPT